MSFGSSDKTQNGDAILAEILDNVAREMQAGHPVDLDKLLLEHTAYADELRGLLPAIHVLADLSRAEADHSQPRAVSSEESLASCVLGDFRILNEIGRGGMGIVYEAHQISLGRQVAIKTLPFASLLDARQLQRFRNEARAAAMLTHPNIVGVHSVGCERGVHYYAMELVDGRSLAQLLGDQQTALHSTSQSSSNPSETKEPAEVADTSPFAALSTHRSDSAAYVRSAVRMCVILAEAIQFAHEHGILHRDIKPGNILVDSQGKPWVTDFGLAQVQSDQTLTVTGDVLGSLRYMSPEQAAGEKLIDQRTDIYSLGMTLFELVALRHPLDNLERPALIKKVTDGEVPRPRHIRPEIPTDLETVILKAVAAEKENRYDSATALAEDLVRFLDHKPIKARRISRAAHFWRWAKRNPVVATLTGAVALLILVLAVGGPLAAIGQHALSEKTRVQNYVLVINAAKQAWNRRDGQRTRQLLKQHIPDFGQDDLRGFEWHHLWGRCNQLENVPMLRHPERVTSIAYSPNGETLATTSVDGVLRLWNPNTQSLMLQRTDLKADPRAIVYSPDGKLVAAGGSDGIIYVWDASSLEETATLDGHKGRVQSLAFSSDGTTLASAGNDNLIILWHAVNEATDWQKKLELKGHDHWVSNVAFSPDGKLLASSSKDGTAILWRMPSGELLRRLPAEITSASAIAFSSDGTMLATAGTDVKLWRTDTWELTARFDVPGRLISTLAFSPDDAFLVVGGTPIVLWEIKSRKPVAITGHGTRIRSVALSPDGNMLASGSFDGDVKLWNTKRLKMRRAPQQRPMTTRVAFATSNSRQALVAVHGRNGSDTDVGQLRIWDIAACEQLFIHDFEMPVYCVAQSPRHSNLVVTGGGNGDIGEVKLWDVNVGAAVTSFTGHTRTVAAVAFSPDGRQLATSSLRWSDPENSEIILWDLDRRELLMEFQGHGALSLAFSTDGQYLFAGCSISPNGKIRCFELSSGKLEPVFTLDGADHKHVTSLCFSPSGRLLAAGDLTGSVKLWNVGERTEQVKLRGPHQNTCVAFSPDGNSIAAGGHDSLVKLWHVGSCDELLTFEMNTSVTSIAFSDDGRTLAVACTDKSVTLLHYDGREDVFIPQPSTRPGRNDGRK